MRRAAPGPQVSQGRIRVDAARAIQKLREYQLADRAAWVLEGIRAAVAAGATKIELRGDANDIWLGWHGTPWEADVLPRLFDELVSPEISDEKQHVRLLAAAVNSALGMNPAFVDVYSITAAGQAQRARYTPDVLAEPENELGEAPLRHVAVEQHEPPTEIASGVLVHLRRRASLQLLSYWIGEPPELPLARGACRDIDVPLVVDEDIVLQRDAKRDVVRVPLDDGFDGFVAITDDLIDPGACFEVAERGVVLARYDLQILGFAAQLPIPVRVFLDAERLPTNASRSQVRRDVHPIATAERRAKQVIATAIAQLAKQFGDGKGDVARRSRAAALSLLAASVGGHPVGWKHIPAVLAPLADLPLCRNAFGEPRKVTADWSTNIHTEKSPLDADLEPWIDEILWAPPGDDVRRMLVGFMVDVAAMRRHTRTARQQRRAHKRFLSHAKRDVKVQSAIYPRVRLSIGVMVERSCVPQQLFTEVTGEICVYSTGNSAAVVLCVEGRELERVELASDIPFDAVLDSKLLTPSERYRGVRRDAGYASVDLALRAGVVRAVESIAAESARVIETDLPLIRSALVLAKEHGFEIGGPLAQAAVWRTADGKLASHAELEREACIGVIADGETLVPPAGRVVVHANGNVREDLKRLYGKRVVSYHRAVGRKRLDLNRMARAPNTDRIAYLKMVTDDMRGAIVLAPKATIALHHMGVPLSEHEYKFALVKCAISVDSDRIVPNDRWNGAIDDIGLREGGFRDWELALLRAIALRVIGEDVPDLVTPERIVVNDPNFEALAHVLLEHDLIQVLGVQLLDKVRAHPLFMRLGSTSPVSIRQLGNDHPQGIFFIDEQAEAVDDFAPVMVSNRTALLIGKIARRPVHDGKHELRRRQRLALRHSRMQIHLAKAEHPAQLASETPTATFVGKRVRGVLGLTSMVPEVRIHVENRPFSVVPIAVGYPLVAAVDLAPDGCTETFEGVANLVIEEIADDLRAAVPALLDAIASSQPRLLGEPGPARRMLATFLAAGKITNELRAKLRSVPAFVTVQGDYRSIEEVEEPPTYLPVATLGEEWLARSDGEQPAAHDRPILAVARPADELNAIIGKLHMDVVADVTTDVARLQARRRMARGLLPMPKVTGTPAALTRPLHLFGELTKRLGPGEVGFAMSSQSTLLIHEQGQLQRTVDIDVMPAILLAIEAPHEVLDHPSMVRLAQDLALELTRVALPKDPPEPLRRNLARGVLAHRVPPALAGTAPLFERVDGTWIDWAGFSAQLAKYEDVWALTGPLAYRNPLDPERIVILLEAGDIELAAKNGHAVINAKLELELDATARVNMARQATELELPSREGVLVEVPLEGNGVTGPRGIVAVLVPQAAGRRGILAHRAMHPFDRIDDVCRWPTLTIVDDARIVPDRTWSAPEEDETWQAIIKEVREASEAALAVVGEAPAEALAEIRITNHVCSDVRALRSAPRSLIRGLLWLSAVPFTPVNVVFHHRGGVRTFVPKDGIAVGGALVVHSDDDLDIGAALEQLCGICHGKLVRMLTKDKDVDRGIAAAHIAHAIAIETVKPPEISGVEFGCFAPRPLEPRHLASLFRRTDPVALVKAGTTDIAETAFVNDDSELAKVVRVHLGDRLTRRLPPPKPSPPRPPAKPPVSTVRPAAQPSPKLASPPKPAPSPKPRKPHVLQPVVDALVSRIARLGIQTFRWEIDGESEPMVRHAGSQVIIAGDNARLRRIATELAADTIVAARALDMLAAHVVSVLNIARTDITDGTEMHALGVLLATQPSEDPPRSRRSS